VGGEVLEKEKARVVTPMQVVQEEAQRGGPRRAWFTLSLLGTTLLRRPSVFKEAVSFAIVHKAFYEYMRQLQTLLDTAVREFDRPAPEPGPIS